jgi:hypothetical protein
MMVDEIVVKVVFSALYSVVLISECLTPDYPNLQIDPLI